MKRKMDPMKGKKDPLKDKAPAKMPVKGKKKMPAAKKSVTPPKTSPAMAPTVEDPMAMKKPGRKKKTMAQFEKEMAGKPM